MSFPWREAPYQEQEDGWEAASIWGSIQSESGAGGGKGDRATAQLASHLGVHTSRVTSWKKQLMAQVAELCPESH